MRKEKITKSSGNIFADLGLPPEEVAILTMRADLMARLRLLVERKGWTQARAATMLGISQSRVSDLVRGKWEKFSLDMLVMLATRAGLNPKLKLAKAA
jgi:predicted XRE-type DNA-binding protein